MEERTVVNQFETHHFRSSSGRFVVPLPRKLNMPSIGESRSQAVRRFLYLERALSKKGLSGQFNDVMSEYFEMGHAEPIPVTDLNKPPSQVFYLPMHIVQKESSSTTKIRAVFDASAKSSTGISLNDTLLVGPTVHSPLVDVLLRFRLYRIALTTDVSRMYRAVELTESDRDFHRFVWRSDPNKPLQDHRMTRVTFGVSASPFAANMAVRQNAIDNASEFPLAVKAVFNSFYVDDGLIGADSKEEAIVLQQQLQGLFAKGGFLLRKWNSNAASVIQTLPPELQDSRSILSITESQGYTKTLGVEWHSKLDHFRLTMNEPPSFDNLTKRGLVSDIAKTFDVLGWFSPTMVKAKILLQRVWEVGVDWDQDIPQYIAEEWLRWRMELKLLSKKHISRYYFHEDASIKELQLHGFCDASENAYASVVYLRMTDSKGKVHVSLVLAKTKVAPIKRLTIPRLELCGAYLLAKVLHHVKGVLDITTSKVFAWTDSTIVLDWLKGNPRRFKQFVGNRISLIMELIPSAKWSHVNGVENPADCASRGMFPLELIGYKMWWSGPDWLKVFPDDWTRRNSSCASMPEEDCSEELCHHTHDHTEPPIIPLNRYSDFNHLKRITAWIIRFINHCQKKNIMTSQLSTKELWGAEAYWVKYSQHECFASKLKVITNEKQLPASSILRSLNPFIDASGILRLSGRQDNCGLAYSRRYPVILHSKHSITQLIIRQEHIRLLHAGPTLLIASLNRRFHVIGMRKGVRSITRSCIVCRRETAKPQSQKMGKLPIERVTPNHTGTVFANVGIDYAGPVKMKYGSVRRPTVVKAYICVFVSLSVKAVHLEVVSDLTTDAFIACLRRFISRRGKPNVIWSDHGTNFVGAARELKELSGFLQEKKTQDVISQFCSSQSIEWKFIPERAPHFGGLWEAAVKSLKLHLKRVVGEVKLTFEKFMTVLTQIEGCLNSRPLTQIPSEDDGIEALTPGHFLIGQPLEAIPDPVGSYRPLPILRRWQLCQSLVRHFWQRWSDEYLVSLRRYNKWQYPTRNVQVNDIVVLQENVLVPCKWPLGRVIEVHKGKDNLVRVVTVKTKSGIYKRPITKIAMLLSGNDST